MGKIKVLDASLANMIAAGEVVERPSSVVKELMENAVDANANEIEVQIYGAGREKIVIRDNGSGMNKEDLQLAFTRHATSKIQTKKRENFDATITPRMIVKLKCTQSSNIKISATKPC